MGPDAALIFMLHSCATTLLREVDTLHYACLSNGLAFDAITQVEDLKSLTPVKD